jgi:preprotein translocase subunit SecG
MLTFFSIIHILVCVFLVLVILLQQGRGGGLGSAFGGTGQQVFGGAGATNFLAQLTEWAAFGFMFTSLILAGLATGGRGKTDLETAAKAVYLGVVASSSVSATPSAAAPITTNNAEDLPLFAPSAMPSSPAPSASPSSPIPSASPSPRAPASIAPHLSASPSKSK